MNSKANNTDYPTNLFLAFFYTTILPVNYEEILKLLYSILTPRQERCVYLKYHDHLTLSEIGKEFNLCSNYIRLIINKAKKRILFYYSNQLIDKMIISSSERQNFKLLREREKFFYDTELCETICEACKELNLLDYSSIKKALNDGTFKAYGISDHTMIINQNKLQEYGMENKLEEPAEISMYYSYYTEIDINETRLKKFPDIYNISNTFKIENDYHSNPIHKSKNASTIGEAVKFIRNVCTENNISGHTTELIKNLSYKSEDKTDKLYSHIIIPLDNRCLMFSARNVEIVVTIEQKTNWRRVK